ncbi:MAG TPA: hypothetical protein VJN18_26300, partial [Polyangiaceae bacterium]|nr:hypothetical protein [Polyangiaceae bacterium]
PSWLQTTLAVLAGSLGIATFLRAILESQRREWRDELKEVHTAVHSLEVRFAAFEARFSPKLPESPAE